MDLETGNNHSLFTAGASIPEKICVVICSIPITILVFIRYIIGGICYHFSNTIQAITELVWELLKVIWTALQWGFDRLCELCCILYDYVLCPAGIVAKRVGVFVFEFGLVPFWNGIVAVYTSIIMPLFVYLYDYILSPGCRLIAEGCKFLFENIINPILKFVCCDFLPGACKLAYTYIWCPVYNTADAIGKFLIDFVFIPIGCALQYIGEFIFERIFLPIGYAFQFIGDFFAPLCTCISNSLLYILNPICEFIKYEWEASTRCFTTTFEWCHERVLKPLWSLIDRLVNAINKHLIVPLLKFFNIPTRDTQGASQVVSEATPLTTILGTELRRVQPS